MKQKTTAQIREELRKDMTKMFEKKYQQYIMNDGERCKRYRELYHNELEKRIKKNYECAELKEENLKLKDKVAQYEDWINRLQEFMDIEDDKERKVAFETYIKEKQSRAEFENLMDVYCNMFNRIFTY